LVAAVQVIIKRAVYLAVQAAAAVAMLILHIQAALQQVDKATQAAQVQFQALVMYLLQAAAAQVVLVVILQLQETQALETVARVAQAAQEQILIHLGHLQPQLALAVITLAVVVDLLIFRLAAQQVQAAAARVVQARLDLVEQLTQAAAVVAVYLVMVVLALQV
jgi:hypothetical protein